MAGYFEESRRAAFRVVRWQGLVAVAAAAAGFLMGGKLAGASALAGGGIGTLANLAMVWRVYGGAVQRDPQGFLARMVLGETLKFAVTVVLFVLAIVVFKAAFLPLILGYVAVFAAYVLGFMRISIGQAR